MSTLDDPDAINFEGLFEFIKGPTNCRDGRRKFGPSGVIDMTFGDVSPFIIKCNLVLYKKLYYFLLFELILNL